MSIAPESATAQRCRARSLERRSRVKPVGTADSATPTKELAGASNQANELYPEFSGPSLLPPVFFKILVAEASLSIAQVDLAPVDEGRFYLRRKIERITARDYECRSLARFQ